MRAFLIGTEPARDLGYDYVTQPPFDAVVIGSLTVGELLFFGNEVALDALGSGKTVVIYTPGLPESPKNRALSASLASAKRLLKSWGVLFTEGAQKRLITAQEARSLRAAGRRPEPGAVLTPLAKEIMEELQ